MISLNPKVSVIIPAYNEAQNLPLLIRRIASVFSSVADHDYECIVVNDASTDETDQVLHALAAAIPELRYLNMTRNSGQSAALLAGMRMASGTYIITMDADLQNDPNDIPLLLEKLQHYDCVCGYRAGRHDSPGRRLTSYLGNLVRRWIVDDGIRDAGCGIKGFRRECLAHIIPFHGVHRFFAAMVRNGGLSVTEVPVSHHPRIHGQSKYGFLNRIFWVLYDFVGVGWLRKRYLVIAFREENIHVTMAAEALEAPEPETTIPRETAN